MDIPDIPTYGHPVTRLLRLSSFFFVCGGVSRDDEGDLLLYSK